MAHFPMKWENYLKGSVTRHVLVARRQIFKENRVLYLRHLYSHNKSGTSINNGKFTLVYPLRFAAMEGSNKASSGNPEEENTAREAVLNSVANLRG